MDSFVLIGNLLGAKCKGTWKHHKKWDFSNIYYGISPMQIDLNDSVVTGFTNCVTLQFCYNFLPLYCYCKSPAFCTLAYIVPSVILLLEEILFLSCKTFKWMPRMWLMPLELLEMLKTWCQHFHTKMFGIVEKSFMLRYYSIHVTI